MKRDSALLTSTSMNFSLGPVQLTVGPSSKPPENSEGPLEPILKQVEAALEANLWYAALTITLSLPDICSLLPLPPNEIWSKRAKYAAWFDKNLSDNYGIFTGDDCYSIRGGVLHHGKFGHHKSRYDRVVFAISSPANEIIISGNTLNNVESGTILSLHLGRFCENVVAAARAWYEANKEDENVKRNIAGLVHYRPNGLSPWLVGGPMIA